MLSALTVLRGCPFFSMQHGLQNFLNSIRPRRTLKGVHLNVVTLSSWSWNGLKLVRCWSSISFHQDF